MLAGLVLGMVMAVRQDFSLVSVHSHIGLLGWAAMAITGLAYLALPKCGQSRLAAVHFWLHNIGVPLLLGSLAFMMLSGAHLPRLQRGDPAWHAVVMPSPLEDRARALAMAQNFGPDALDLNRRLVAANPADAGSRTRLARCYLEAGRLDEAEAEYREVLRLDARNRIAAGGLEMIAGRRRQLEVPAEELRPVRRARAPRAAGAVRRTAREPLEPEAAGPESSEPVPQSFAGFGRDAFAELAACHRRSAVHARFAPRVVDLLRRVNALPSSVEIAGVREAGKRQLFRVAASDVHAEVAHWHAFNMGGRWEMQWNIAMYAGRAVGDWLRIGLGFNLAEAGVDPARTAGVAEVRDAFGRFQEIVDSPRGSLFLGWMVKEEGLIQVDERAPRLDVREPSQAAKLISELDPERTDWVFFGKWLRPDNAADAAVLEDPVTLVRTIDRVFMGLLPLFRAMREAGV
jgi:hypothetical protein